MRLGRDSALVGELEIEIDDGQPTGDVAKAGPTIDCRALANPVSNWQPDDFNGWRLACVEMSSGVMAGVAIDNGIDRFRRFEATRRNAILVTPSEGRAVIQDVVLTDARRGVLAISETDATTQVSVRRALIERTELAGVFSITTDEVSQSVDRATVDVEVTESWFNDIGLHSMLMYAGVGGDHNQTTGSYRDNVVNDTCLFGLTVMNNGFQDTEALTNTTTTFELSGGRIASSEVGLAVWYWDDGPQPDNVDNTWLGEINDVTFVGNGTAIELGADPWGPGNFGFLDVEDNTYEGADAGTVFAGIWDFDEDAYVTDGAESVWGLAGTRSDFDDDNDNFDSSSIADLFESDDDDD